MKRARPWSRLLALVGLLAAGCAGEARVPPRSAVIITLDTTRADALTCLGGPAGITPHLDALAREGILYVSARTVSPITLPSHASMFTGLYPPRHTVRVNSVHALPESARTLAESARDAGMDTAAFVASVVLADSFGLDQGFDLFDQPPPPPKGVEVPGQAHRRSAVDVVAKFMGWFWARDAERPFLAWIHLYDPHAPYDPANPHRAKDSGDGYLAEVAAADAAVGRVVEALDQRGLLDETLILVVGDHGEGRGEHGETTHSALIYESTMRVPMIVRHHDGHRAGERSAEAVSVVDVYPTLIEALGLEGERSMDGVALYEDEVEDGRGVYMESFYGFYSFGWSPLAAWSQGDRKYIHSSSPELFDISADPDELNNRVDAGEVEAYLAAIERVLALPGLERDEGDLASDSMVAYLQDLGYTGAAPVQADPARLFDPDRPSPSSRMEAYRTFLATEDRSSVESVERSVAGLEGLLAENPRNHSAWLQLGSMLLDLRRYEESMVATRKALELGREWYAPVLNIALALDALERYEEAAPHYERAVKLAPGLESHAQRLMEIYNFLGRPEKAQEVRTWFD